MVYRKRARKKCNKNRKRRIRKKSNKNFKALLIGINYIGTDAELSGCINDIKNISSFLKKQYNPLGKNIKILTEEQSNPKLRPTKANILRELQWLIQDAKGDEKCQMFLHYSGHGSWEWDLNGDEEDRRDETICPLDYATNGMITDDDFRETIVDPISKNKNAKLHVLLDCCHSGTGFDLHYTYKMLRRSNKVFSYRIGQNKTYTKCDAQIVMFSGCKDNQTSADAYISRKYQGAMTWSFLKTINDFKRAKRKLTYKKLLTSAQDLLRKHKYTQIPQLSSGHYLDLKSICTF